MSDDGPGPLSEDDRDDLVAYLIAVVGILRSDRNLPKFQFERHVDSLLMPFLPEILRERCLGGTFTAAVSEFPLKHVASNRSTNADALLYQEGADDGSENTWWLFELKTDQRSVKPAQVEPYRRACERTMQELLDDVALITRASRTGRRKYEYLRGRVDALDAPYDAPVRLAYLSPRPVPLIESVLGASAVFLDFQHLVEHESERHPAAWRLVRDELLAPIVA